MSEPLSHRDLLPLPDYSFCPVCGAGLVLQAVDREEKKQLVCSGCGFVLYRNPKVIVGAIFQHHERIVLGRRGIEPGYGRWIYPGGYVDIGETVEEAACREALEETGVEIALTGLLNVYSYSDLPAVLIVFAAEIRAGEPRAADEFLEIRGFKAAEIPWRELAFPSTQAALYEYTQRHISIT